jgi:flagellin
MDVEYKFKEELQMIINHNLNAMNSHRNLTFNNAQQGKSSEKLSSGYRINRAADDAAGLSISEQMRSQIKGMNQGMRNAQDGISLVQTAEGAMNEVSDMLTRMKELSVQSQNNTYNQNDRNAMDAEYTSLSTAINDIATNTKFNGITLLDGSASATFTIQTGGGTADRVVMNLAAIKVDTATLGLAAGVGSAAQAFTASGQVDTAITSVNTARSSLGAYQNQLERQGGDATIRRLKAESL